LDRLAAVQCRRDLERMDGRVRLVKERAEVEQMINEAIAQLDGRGLTKSTPEQRVEARGLVAALREVRAYVSEARTLHALSMVAEVFVIDALRQAGELSQQLERGRQHPQVDSGQALVDPSKPESGRSRDLGVVPEHVVHPVLLGGWWLRSPSPRRKPDEVA